METIRIQMAWMEAFCHHATFSRDSSVLPVHQQVNNTESCISFSVTFVLGKGIYYYFSFSIRYRGKSEEKNPMFSLFVLLRIIKFVTYLMNLLRGNAHKNRAKSENCGHNSKSIPPSF